MAVLSKWPIRTETYLFGPCAGRQTLAPKIRFFYAKIIKRKSAGCRKYDLSVAVETPPNNMRESELGSLLSRNAVFRNFLAASTISLVGSNIFDIAMPLYMIQRTHSATALALVTVGLTLPYFLMAPLTGYSADHLDNRLVMLVSDLGQVVCMLFLLVYVLSGCEATWPIFIAIFAAKSMMILFETVSTFQLIPALVPSEDLPWRTPGFFPPRESYRLWARW